MGPHDQVHFLSRITYSYIGGLLREAYRRPLQMANIGKLPFPDSCAENFAAVYRRWKHQAAMHRGLRLRRISAGLYRLFVGSSFRGWGLVVDPTPFWGGRVRPVDRSSPQKVYLTYTC